MRLKCWMIGIVCFIVLTACGREEEPLREDKSSGIETEDNSEVILATETEIYEDIELNLMQKVLLNRAEYYGDGSDDDNTSDRWRKVEELDYFDSKEYKKYFYVQDLDCDGKNEVIVDYVDQIMIFHEVEGSVYGYKMTNRAMSPLYDDGTFLGSAGASDNDLMGNIRFDENEMYYDIITSTTLDTSKEENVAYYKNGGWWSQEAIEITQEEYKAIMAGYQLNKDTTYEFNLNNILEYVK